jgi:hypothetical protein
MNERAFDRIAEAFMADGPTVVSDRVLDAALDEVHLTRQRRVLVRVPWRTPVMNTYAKYAAVAVIVIAIGAVGLAVLRPGGSPDVGAPPVASPSPTPSPTPAPTPAALTARFTSDIHGLSIASPEGWSTRPATTPWTSGGPVFTDPFVDVIYDSNLEDHLVLMLGSQPLGDRTPQQWTEEKLAEECGSAMTEPITIGGQPGDIGAGDCNFATVSVDGRGYLIVLYTSGDEAWIGPVYDRDWFEQVLGTVELEPDQAVDTP